jgi:hypothetical protein
VKVVFWNIDDVTPYEKNPRLNDQAVDAVARSIQAFGFRQPIVVDAVGIIIVGHTRWKAAKKLGLAKVPVHMATDLTPDQVKALIDTRYEDSSASPLRIVMVPCSMASDTQPPDTQRLLVVKVGRFNFASRFAAFLTRRRADKCPGPQRLLDNVLAMRLGGVRPEDHVHSRPIRRVPAWQGAEMPRVVTPWTMSVVKRCSTMAARPILDRVLGSMVTGTFPGTEQTMASRLSAGGCPEVFAASGTLDNRPDFGRILVGHSTATRRGTRLAKNRHAVRPNQSLRTAHRTRHTLTCNGFRHDN